MAIAAAEVERLLEVRVVRVLVAIDAAGALRRGGLLGLAHEVGRDGDFLRGAAREPGRASADQDRAADEGRDGKQNRGAAPSFRPKPRGEALQTPGVAGSTPQGFAALTPGLGATVFSHVHR